MLRKVPVPNGVLRKVPALSEALFSALFLVAAFKFGRLIFIHLQCWEVLPFLTIQRQRCIKILCPKDPEFYTPLALSCQKEQHLPALVVHKNQPVTSFGGLFWGSKMS